MNNPRTWGESIFFST